MEVRQTIILLFVFTTLFCNSQNTYSRAKKFFLDNDIEAAIASLDSCAAQKEYADSALYLKAYLCAKNNRLQEAEALCNELHKRNKDFYEVWYVRGLLSSMRGKHALAAEQFTKVINYQPSNCKALYNRALSKAMLDDFRGAIQDLDKCIQADPVYANAYYSRAYWHETLLEYEPAISDYEKTISLDKNYKEAWLALAYVLDKKGDRKKACDVLHKAIDNGVTAANDLTDNFCK